MESGVKSTRKWISKKNKEFLYASSKGNLEQVESLITQGADVNFMERNGNTPLHLAVESGHQAVVELLLSKGADVRIENKQKKTAVQLAKRLKNPDIMLILKGKNLQESQNKKLPEKQKPYQIVQHSKKNINEIQQQQPEAVKREIQNRQTQLVNAVHGNIYQLKVLMLFLYRGVSRKYSFRLGTEIEEAEKFDDLVFEYTQDGGKVYRLLQAKHKLDESKKITIESLLNENNGDYSLKKYFLAYQAVKKEDMFKDGSIKDVTICTNIDFDVQNLEGLQIRVERIEDEDDILDVECDKKQPVRYKLIGNVVGLLKEKLAISAKYSDEEIQDFMDHLVFAVCQPNEEELGDIVKKEIGQQFDIDTTENVYNKLFMEMLKQLQGKGKDRFLSYEEGKEFFEEARRGIPIFFRVRDPVASFVGRTEQLDNLHKMLQGEREAAEPPHVCISGLGGIGKSEICRKYIREHSNSYVDKIVWINAESYQTLSESFRTLASNQLKINTKNVNGEEKKTSCIVEEVYRFFSKGKSLFVFDNAEKYTSKNENDDGIKDFLPSLPPNYNRPCILITSRNQKWPEKIKILPLDVFTEDEVKEFIEKSLKIENDTQEEDIKELGMTLQYFPLALQQVVAYIRILDDKLRNVGREFKVSNFLERFKEKTRELLNFEFPEESDDNYTKTLCLTWNVTLDSIEQKEAGIEALDIFNIVSYLNPENIPTEMFSSLVPDAEKLGSAIELLKQYSMVYLNNAMLSVHRLVQQVTRKHLEDKKRVEGILSKALKLSERENMASKYVDHALSIWNYTMKFGELVKEFVPIAIDISRELINRLRCEEAFLFGEKVLSVLEEMPLDNPEILSRFRELYYFMGLELLYIGNYDKALEHFKSEYNFSKSNLGKDHWKTLFSKSNIVDALIKKGEYNEALKSVQEVLSVCKNTLGENHFVTLRAKHHMAVIFNQKGKYTEGLQILQEIYKIQEASFGKDDQNVLQIKNDIAITLSRLCNYDEALRIHQEISNIQKTFLNKNHPKFLQTKRNIALVLCVQGKYRSAYKVCQEVFESQKTFLGEKHHDILFTQKAIAEILQRLGKYDQALEIIQDIYPKIEGHYGSNHPTTLDTLLIKAVILNDKGKYNDALQMCQEVLSKIKVVLGDTHPDTLRVIHFKAEIYLEIGENDKALQLNREVLEFRERILGENHFDTLNTKKQVGRALYKKMKFDEALQILQDVYNTSKELFPDHPSTFNALTNIYQILVSQMKFNEALKILKEALYFRESNLEEEDEPCINLKRDIALVLKSMGKSSEALIIIQECFNISNKLFGQEDPETLRISEIMQSLEKDANDLLNAVKNNNFNELKYLVESGGHINTKDNDNLTLLHYSVNNCNMDIVNLLLKNGADVTCITSKGNTPLHTATNKGSIEIVQVLLQYVKEEELNDFVNARTTSDGNTSLHIAAKKGFLEIVDMLLKHGAIYDIENRESKTPLDLSENQHVIDLLKLVAELFEDARNGNMDVISKLKSVKYNVFSAATNARNKQGNTLLQVVKFFKHKEIKNKLLEMLNESVRNSHINTEM